MKRSQFIVLDSYEISLLGYDLGDPDYLKGKEMITSVNKNQVSSLAN